MPRKASTTTSTKIAPKLHSQLSTGDVNSIIEGALNSSHVTPASSPKKRKTTITISDDDDSVVEIVGDPQPSPKKARPGTPPPSPGSSEYKNLPAVSVSDMLDNIMRPGSSIAFGTTGRPVRTKVKTEKAAVLEKIKTARKSKSKAGKATDSAAELTPQSVPPPPVLLSSPEMTHPKTHKAKKIPATSPTPKTPKIKGADDDVVMSSPSPVKDLRKRGKLYPKAAASDDELPMVSELLLSTPKNKNKSRRPPSIERKPSMLENVLDLEAAGSEDGSSDSNQGSDNYLATDDDGEVGYHTVSDPAEQDGEDDGGSVHSDSGGAAGSADDATVPENDGASEDGDGSEDPDAVTSPLYQDSALRRIYENLPFLPKLTPILPFSQTSAPTSDRYVFSTIAAALNASEADTLLKAMLFTQSGVHVNLSRIHPNLLQQEGGRIRMKRPDNAAAVAMFPGVTTNSAIAQVELVGPPSSQYGVHGLSVAGSEQETRRYEAILGFLLGYDSITGNVSKDGLSFYTRGQGKDVNFGPPPSTAASASSTRPISALMSSVALPAPISHARGYPASRSFDERIPVYDGRVGSGRKFNFTDDDFKKLSSWPLYHRGRGEIDLGTLVSVGHTISTYGGISGRYISTNVQFVIVLGQPAISL